jgi:hypothetical protein
MNPTARRCRRRLSEEDAYSRFSEMFDLDVFALELEHSDRIGAVIRKGVEDALDRKQRDFEAILAEHPATIAEESLRALARQLEDKRLQKIARRWYTRLVSRRAS